MHTIIIGAIIVPIVALTAGALARWLGRWLRQAISETVAEGIRDVVAPDIKKMGDSLGVSLDEMRSDNARDHQGVTDALSEMSGRIDVQTERIDALETVVTELAKPKETPPP